MCLGIPMQVMAVEPGHVRCVGRLGLRRVRSALVGEVAVGDWLLVFLDSAQERISAERAREVDATLDMIEAVMQGEGGDGDAAFALPSAMSEEQLRALSGAAARSEHSPQGSLLGEPA
ncbi:MAG: HypC/HybG/HupF family hydrogenase formation chaperone [Methyloversatilis sp.]|uniref:Hydrogenase expression/formation protein hoxL n=1 Tax=Methyloversatilis universalis (strain ATCC BAA-1314 / DSM 25237 / JCM 13912 / CCUG 52030 / FAM5) TaxID=1000565 RepID=F5RGC4_METUF|nr:HypC/HybG/HupF family hydrogenase formation chaperone [Methyloversatilis universalis]EGK70316.1 Hydrogenase expression/formation protein hoxL [Methyloversatilis universalis FAM5]MCP4635238.1 HypC/HybG/HupF family hydrogenase formation chaperone [Methyloversatilis sp.]